MAFHTKGHSWQQMKEWSLHGLTHAEKKLEAGLCKQLIVSLFLTITHKSISGAVFTCKYRSFPFNFQPDVSVIIVPYYSFLTILFLLRLTAIKVLIIFGVLEQVSDQIPQKHVGYVKPHIQFVFDEADLWPCRLGYCPSPSLTQTEGNQSTHQTWTRGQLGYKAIIFHCQHYIINYHWAIQLWIKREWTFP